MPFEGPFWRFGLLLAVCATPPLAFTSSSAAVAQSGNSNARENRAGESELARLQRLEAQLFATGWRLASANAEFCDNAAPSIGLLLHDAQSYGDPDAVRAELGLSGDIAVQAVAPGSPAEAAQIRTNDTLVEAASANLPRDFPSAEVTGEPRWKRMAAVNDRIDAHLAHNGSALLVWEPAVTDSDKPPMGAVVHGVPTCPSRFEVHLRGKGAMADGTRVILGHKFPGFAYAEDEFAAAVAHELAHNLLGHRALLDAKGRSNRLVRLTERDADRLMPWLLANAGYDPHAASRFMQRWGPRHGGGLFRKRSHDGWDERVELIEAEIAAVEAALANDAKANWATGFTELARAKSADD